MSAAPSQGRDRASRATFKLRSRFDRRGATVLQRVPLTPPHQGSSTAGASAGRSARKSEDAGMVQPACSNARQAGPQNWRGRTRWFEMQCVAVLRREFLSMGNPLSDRCRREQGDRRTSPVSRLQLLGDWRNVRGSTSSLPPARDVPVASVGLRLLRRIGRPHRRKQPPESSGQRLHLARSGAATQGTARGGTRAPDLPSPRTRAGQ
jgi:hypothetical protein